MTVTAIDIFFGFLVPIKAYLEILAESFQEAEEEEEEATAKDSPNDGETTDREDTTDQEVKATDQDVPNEPTEEEDLEDQFCDLISEMCWGNKPLVLKAGVENNVESEVLKAGRLTHDVDESCPLVIGLNLGTSYDSHYYYKKEEKLVPAITISKLLESKAIIEAEVDKLKSDHPKLYQLLKDKELQIVMVQNDCRCCS